MKKFLPFGIFAVVAAVLIFIFWKYGKKTPAVNTLTPAVINADGTSTNVFSTNVAANTTTVEVQDPFCQNQFFDCNTVIISKVRKCTQDEMIQFESAEDVKRWRITTDGIGNYYYNGIGNYSVGNSFLCKNPANCGSECF